MTRYRKVKNIILRPVLLQYLNSLKNCCYSSGVISLVFLFSGIIATVVNGSQIDSMTIFYLMMVCLFLCFSVVPITFLSILLLHATGAYRYGLYSDKLACRIPIIYSFSFLFTIILDIPHINSPLNIVCYYCGTFTIIFIAMVVYRITHLNKYNKRIKIISRIRNANIGKGRIYVMNKVNDNVVMTCIIIIILWFILSCINVILSQ